MRQTALLMGGLAALVISGCHDSASNDVPETQMELVFAAVTKYAGDPIRVTVSAHNDQVALRTLTIDFTGDGVWDETREFDSRAISEDFVHVYPSPGTYLVRADITDRIGRTVSRSVEVFVFTAPPTVPVTLLLHGISPEGGGCYAEGTPATCQGCTMLLGTSTSPGLTRSLDGARRGTPIRVDQGFNQWPVIAGRQTYACQFTLQLFAGNPGSERLAASGTCDTSSHLNPPQLGCLVTVEGIVP